MGFLMFAGLIGSIAYTGHVIKKDIEAEVIDYQTKPTMDIKYNRKKIENNFNIICKRAGIDINNNNPIKKHQCNKGIEYLQYQGYDNVEIETFKKIFLERYELGKIDKKKEIVKRNKKLIKLLKNESNKELVVFRKRIYKSDITPQKRMNKLLRNNLWKRIVHHHTYIRSDIGEFEEIWTLKVPKNFFKKINKNQLYDDICYLENVYNRF